MRPDDLEHCRAAIRTGSKSFHAASRLLPSKVRDPALALYAFCRLADDEVDEGSEKGRAVLDLQERLDAAYAGRPKNAPEDRAFAGLIEEFEMPRALPEALLEGLAWDAMERRYQTLSEIRDYSARVASAVGAMMCVLMEVRDGDALARACDLGVAMQLTNIARDIGEDARAGRLYLPLEWFDNAGLEPEKFLNDPQPSRVIRRMAAKLLAESRRLYARSESGISALPLSVRPGIFAARHIYAGIGTAVRRQGFDSITHRAHTGSASKVGWLMLSGLRSAGTIVLPTPAVLFAPPLAETQFLVDAASKRDATDKGRAVQVLDILAQIRRQELTQQVTPGE